MRIILVEFSWHAQEIIKNKEYFNKDVIVSLDPESSYILKINKIPYFVNVKRKIQKIIL